MHQSIEIKIENLIIKGDFEKATKELEALTKEEIETQELDQIPMWISYDKANICGYGFACYLTSLHESSANYILVSKTLEFGMPQVEGSYAVAYHRTKMAIELDPENKDLYLYLLSFYSVPESQISTAEAREIAKKYLSKWPNEASATDILESTAEYADLDNYSKEELIKKNFYLEKQEALKTCILQGWFLETQKYLQEFSNEEVENILLNIAKEKRNVCAYDYVWFLIREKGISTKKHLLLATISQYLFEYKENAWWNISKGSKQLYFFHINQAAKLEPENLEIQEKLLKLYEPDNQCFDLEETKALVERILKVNPKNQAALRVLNLIG